MPLKWDILVNLPWSLGMLRTAIWILCTPIIIVLQTKLQYFSCIFKKNIHKYVCYIPYLPLTIYENSWLIIPYSIWSSPTGPSCCQGPIFRLSAMSVRPFCQWALNKLCFTCYDYCSCRFTPPLVSGLRLTQGSTQSNSELGERYLRYILAIYFAMPIAASWV